MTPNDPADDLFLIDDPISNQPWFRVGDAVSWLFPLLGLLLFEWFADPCLGIIISCVKFGYRDFKTAEWLGSDANVSRGEVLSRCYTARGLFVVSVAAFVITGVLIICNPLWNQNQPLDTKTIWMGLMLWVFGLLLGTAQGVAALHRAIRYRVRVWMDSTIHQARYEKRWSLVCSGRTNQFHWLSLGVSSVGVLLLGGVAIMVHFGITQQDWAGVFLGALPFGVPSWWILSRVWQSWSLAATTPNECWGDANQHV